MKEIETMTWDDAIMVWYISGWWILPYNNIALLTYSHQHNYLSQLEHFLNKIKNESSQLNKIIHKESH